MPSIYEAILEAERGGEPAALATVIRARGSVPRHETSKMLVFGDGRIETYQVGGIEGLSDSHVEFLVLRRAIKRASIESAR